MSWKLTTSASKEVIEGVLARQEEHVGWNDDIVLTGFEVVPDEPDLWQLDAYMAEKPSQAQRNAVKALFEGEAPRLKAEELPDTDWVSESQKGIDPIRAGRFHVRTPDHPALDEAGVVDFCIPAAQAFGTGQHETTAGCLAMLDAMKQRGIRARHIADIGNMSGANTALLHRIEHGEATSGCLMLTSAECLCGRNAEIHHSGFVQRWMIGRAHMETACSNGINALLAFTHPIRIG